MARQREGTVADGQAELPAQEGLRRRPDELKVEPVVSSSAPGLWQRLASGGLFVGVAGLIYFGLGLIPAEMAWHQVRVCLAGLIVSLVFICLLTTSHGVATWRQLGLAVRGSRVRQAGVAFLHDLLPHRQTGPAAGTDQPHPHKYLRYGPFTISPAHVVFASLLMLGLLLWRLVFGG